ncbi:4-hydroxy-tetrahydrodipicolinate synthase [Lujinxingia litoralis]|uniref:4-hydroxy-tetrahydrodipicolinate synthase n=1 Tax=Lujinxingia litoralis TaxID=2211119 RepID=A0A328CBR5_9DELT|nr:4-hydroxy-tetrahydrodipicolinate synthase [Lujinxingia litoralis]RAL22967.1 4-hydroxy-tetrahydrodipicolinate synthase [Lujinxingia litoralis]
MSSTPALRGALTALITPFTDSGSVDFDALRALVDRQIAGGINGLVPCGTTGEAATMTEDERAEVIKAVVAHVDGRVPVVAGTGSNCTADTIAFTQRVARENPGKIAAALVVTPYYNKPGQEDMIRHFQEVANEGTLPVILYNVPGRTGVSLTAESIITLSAHPNIIGIKDASADMVLGTQIAAHVPADFALLSGDDFTTFPLMMVGGHGCISVVSNLSPETMSGLCNAVNSGDLATALAMHRKLQPLAQVLFERSNPIPVKAAAAALGWCSPTMRGPLYAPDETFIARLRQALADFGLS